LNPTNNFEGKMMKNRRILLAALSAFLCCATSFKPAVASQVIYDGAGILEGTQSFTDSFAVTSPGELTVTLGNVNFPAALSALQLLVSTGSGSLGTMNENTAGTVTSDFNVLSAGNISAQWFGTATGSLDAGAYTLEIQFTPNASGSPVPLPTSIALLLSGVALLFWQRRTRAGMAAAELNDAEIV
jgi:hypothetical protein